MSCSNLTANDISVLKQLHAEQGWEYEFPDIGWNGFVSNRALHDENGDLVGAVLARKTVELYFIGNPTWRTPKWRLEALKMLHEDTRRTLKAQGYGDANCWIPPSVSKSFGRRLKRTFGWNENSWACFSRSTNG